MSRKRGRTRAARASAPAARSAVPWTRRVLAAALAASAALLVVGAVPVWPPAYDAAVRVAVTVSALFAGYVAYEERRTGWVCLLGLAAVVFNPIWPLALSRGNWAATYVVTAALLVAAAVRFRRAPRGIFRPGPRIP